MPFNVREMIEKLRQEKLAKGQAMGFPGGGTATMNAPQYMPDYGAEEEEFSRRKGLGLLSQILNPQMAPAMEAIRGQIAQEEMKNNIGQYIALTEEGVVGKDPKQDMLIATQLGIPSEVVQRMAMIASEQFQAGENEKERLSKDKARLTEAGLARLRLEGKYTPATEEEAAALPGGATVGTTIEKLPGDILETYHIKGPEAARKALEAVTLPHISVNNENGTVLFVNPANRKASLRFIPGLASPKSKEAGHEKNRLDLYNKEVDKFSEDIRKAKTGIETSSIDNDTKATQLENLEKYRVAETNRLFGKYWPGRGLPKNAQELHLDEEDLKAILSLPPDPVVPPPDGTGTDTGKVGKTTKKITPYDRTRISPIDLVYQAVEAAQKAKKGKPGDTTKQVEKTVQSIMGVKTPLQIEEEKRWKERQKKLNALQSLIEEISGTKVY